MSTSEASRFGGRIDAGTWPLAVGDAVVVIGLLTAGAINHNGVAFLTANPVYWAGTVAPFLVGWAVVAPFVGAYSPGAGESAKASVPLAVRSWVLAAVVGTLLRASPLFHGGASVTSLLVFFTVVGLLGAVAVGVWRWLYFRLV